jgi:hypothetical protein
MKHALYLFPLSLVATAGCTQTTPPPIQALDARQLEIEARKDDVVRQLAECESGGNGQSDRPIYGGRGAYVGRFQFTPQAVITFVRERDGRTLGVKEAVAFAHDYGQASNLAKYVLFERDGHRAWPGCSRKLGLPAQVAAIRAM